MNNKNLKTYYEDATGICVYDCETRIGISIDEYTHNVAPYSAEIIPVQFNEDFTDNEVIEVFEHLKTNKMTFTKQGYCDFEHRVSTYYDDDTYDTFRTDDGFVCEIPKSFWEYGMTSEEGSDRLLTCADYIEVLHDVLRESRIALAKERAEEIADDFNDIVVDDATIDSSAFADDIEDALNKDFVSFNDVMNFNYHDIITHLSTCYCLRNDDMKTSYDVKSQLMSDLDIEIGSNVEQMLEDLLLSNFDADDTIIMEDTNNFDVDFKQQVDMVATTVENWD